MSDHLTVKQLSEQTGMPYDSLAELLRRYTAARDLLHPKRERGIWVYPCDQLPQFFRIANLHKSGVSLSSIAKEMALSAQRANAIADSNSPIPLANQEQMDLLTSAFVEAIRRSLPPPDDQLLSLTEAHEAFSPGAGLRSAFSAPLCGSASAIAPFRCVALDPGTGERVVWHACAILVSTLPLSAATGTTQRTERPSGSLTSRKVGLRNHADTR